MLVYQTKTGTSVHTKIAFVVLDVHSPMNRRLVKNRIPSPLVVVDVPAPEHPCFPKTAALHHSASLPWIANTNDRCTISIKCYHKNTI